MISAPMRMRNLTELLSTLTFKHGNEKGLNAWRGLVSVAVTTSTIFFNHVDGGDERTTFSVPRGRGQSATHKYLNGDIKQR
jgi:hypothetical protein